MGNTQEELGDVLHLENCDTVVIMETYSHNWSTAMDGYKCFRGDRQGRKGSRVALYVRECFDCLELDDGDERLIVYW